MEYGRFNKMRAKTGSTHLLPPDRGNNGGGDIRVAGYSVVWDCDPTPIFP